jgi:hypothetical protein
MLIADKNSNMFTGDGDAALSKRLATMMNHNTNLTSILLQYKLSGFRVQSSPMATNTSNNSQLVGWLYGVPRLVRQIQQQHPDETIHFQAGAMLSQDTGPERRGAVVLTQTRVLFSVSWMTPLNLMVLAVTTGSLALWANGGGLPMAVLAAFGVAWLVRRWPYHVEIPLDDGTTIAVEPVEGMTGAYHRLRIQSGAGNYVLTTATAVSEDTQHTLEDLLTQVTEPNPQPPVG